MNFQVHAEAKISKKSFYTSRCLQVLGKVKCVTTPVWSNISRGGNQCGVQQSEEIERERAEFQIILQLRPHRVPIMKLSLLRLSRSSQLECVWTWQTSTRLLRDKSSTLFDQSLTITFIWNNIFKWSQYISLFCFQQLETKITGVWIQATTNGSLNKDS